MSLMLPDPTALWLGKYNVNSLFGIRWVTANHDHGKLHMRDLV